MKKNRKTEELFMRHARQMYNTCLRIIGNKQDAEDALQEAYIKAYLNIESLRSESKFSGWLKQIVVRQAISFHREKIHFVDLDLSNMDLEESGHFNLNVPMEVINREIQALPDGARLIFTLFLIENYTHKEIAKILNISESTSKSQYHRAKNILRKKIERKCE